MVVSFEHSCFAVSKLFPAMAVHLTRLQSGIIFDTALLHLYQMPDVYNADLMHITYSCDPAETPKAFSSSTLEACGLIYK